MFVPPIDFAGHLAAIDWPMMSNSSYYFVGQQRRRLPPFVVVDGTFWSSYARNRSRNGRSASGICYTGMERHLETSKKILLMRLPGMVSRRCAIDCAPQGGVCA